MQISKQWYLCVALVAAVGCGDSDHDHPDVVNTDTGGGGDVVSTDTGEGTDSGGGDDVQMPEDVVMTDAGGGGDSGGGGPMVINGCNPTDYTDSTSMASATVMFAGTSYTPKCLHVSPGTMVTFSGTFSSHPLMPGHAPSRSGESDGTSGSPITATNSGASTTFTFANPGTYPYYCMIHESVGMYGVVWVQ